MNTDNVMTTVRTWLAEQDISVEFAATAAVAVALIALLLLARLLRKVGNATATSVTRFATILGLSWSAQGMLDTAINRYHQPVFVAAVLFVVFEAWLIGRMRRAEEYRADRARRGQFVAAVWTGALIMALVVALGEGWAQAPGRLAIPLLVAYSWYTDLKADDDPGQFQRTSWRLTPRYLLLSLGVLEAGDQDVREVNRDHLRNRMTLLAFRQHHGSKQVNDLFRRKIRLARMKTLADDDDLADVRARLERMDVELLPIKLDPVPVPEEVLQLHTPLVPPARRSRPVADRPVQGVHEIDGKFLRGDELHADGIQRVLASVSPDRPRGISNADLAALYTPALKDRTAEKIGAEARRRINGSVPTG